MDDGLTSFVSVCTPACWTPTDCSHGHPMQPSGRSVPDEVYVCCDERMTTRNRRHLWSEHDYERWRSDPAGSARHFAECARCREDYDDE